VSDKLKFVGRFLGAFLLTFQVVSIDLILLANSFCAGGAGNVTTGLRVLKGRRTGIGPVENSGPASLPGREQTSSTCPGGCASLHRWLIFVAPPGLEIASLSLSVVSGRTRLRPGGVRPITPHAVVAAKNFHIKLMLTPMRSLRAWPFGSTPWTHEGGNADNRRCVMRREGNVYRHGRILL